MPEVATECTCGQLPALEPARRMHALTTDQGTAMAESAACSTCAETAAAERVMSDAAALASDYSGQGARDCTGNEALECQVCGWDGETELAQRECLACGAAAGEECRPMCTGLAASQDAAGEDVTA